MHYTYEEPHQSFTECVFIGGPFDGRREMIDDSLDYIQLAVAEFDPRFVPCQISDQPDPVTYTMQKVTYYRKQLTAEGLRRPLEIFVFDREASTGWLIQKILLAYPEPKGND